MSVTNGFLKLSLDEFELLKKDRDAFERRAREYDESNGYLDMDKAGYELAYMLDDSLTEYSDPEKQPFQNIAGVLFGGNALHPDLDLGYGPAVIIDRQTMKNAIEEFLNLQFDQFFKFANDELVADMLIFDVTEDAVRDYHWTYLNSLINFLQDAVKQNAAVVRY